MDKENLIEYLEDYAKTANESIRLGDMITEAKNEIINLRQEPVLEQKRGSSAFVGCFIVLAVGITVGIVYPSQSSFYFSLILIILSVVIAIRLFYHNCTFEKRNEQKLRQHQKDVIRSNELASRCEEYQNKKAEADNHLSFLDSRQIVRNPYKQHAHEMVVPLQLGLADDISEAEIYLEHEWEREQQFQEIRYRMNGQKSNLNYAEKYKKEIREYKLEESIVSSEYSRIRNEYE